MPGEQSLTTDIKAFRTVVSKLLIENDLLLHFHGTTRCTCSIYCTWNHSTYIVPTITCSIEPCWTRKGIKYCKGVFLSPYDVSDFISLVQECHNCQQYKGCTVNKYLLEKRIVKWPWQYYAMDLPKTKVEFVTLLVGIDRYSRFGHAVPLRNKTSRLVASALESNILSSTPLAQKLSWLMAHMNLKVRSLMPCGIRGA